jgi:hypothetical protein
LCYPRGKNKYKFQEIVVLPKWKKDETEFPVSVSWHKTRGYQCYIPTPIMDELGDPDFIRFILKGKKVEVKAEK